jgi:succinyl-CoA synthetase alpha subunit
MPASLRMGHAGAIISGGKGTADEKIKTLNECGVKTADTPSEYQLRIETVNKSLGNV